MFKWSRVPFSIVFLLIASATLSAQSTNTTSPSEDKLQARRVFGSVTGESIRFTSLGELIQMRLEVIDATGAVLYDSGFKPGNLVDWTLTDTLGQRLRDGSYLCVVTVRESSSQTTRVHAIGSLRDQSVSLTKAVIAMLTAAQVQAAGTTPDESSSLTVIEPGQSTGTAVLAHDGVAAQLVSGSGGLSIGSGDFFANKILEHIRLTAEGNVGIGILNPQAKLDVAGMIRASEGIIFPDGSIQFSASRKTFGAASLRPGQSQPVQGQRAGLVPDTSGTGTTGKIAKWLDGPNGVLNDSNITEASGAIGINSTPDTRFRLDVNGSTRIRGSNPGFNLEGLGNGNIWLFQTVDTDGHFRIFGQDNATPGAERLTISMSTGNVGIGATTPAAKLDVAGNINTTTQYNIGGNRMLSAPGSGNVFVGLNAGSANTSGMNNTFFGALAGQSNNVQGNNSFFGNHAGKLTTVGSNSFFGASAGESNSTGDANAFFGINAGFNNSSGSANAFFGASAGDGNSTGSSNAFFGASAGHNNFTGSSLTIVGDSADVNASNLTNATAIGANAFVAQSNSLVLGSITGTNGATASAAVGIGTISPHTTLDVANSAAQIRFGNTSSDNGGYLVSTASSQAILSGGAKWNGSAWVAKSTAASLVESSGGAVHFFTNDSLAAGSTFSPTQRMVIQSDGNVGIGTTAPANRLHVVNSSGGTFGESSQEYVATIETTTTDPRAPVLALKVDNTGNPSHASTYIGFFNGGDNEFGSISGNDNGGIQLISFSADYAEWLPRLNPAEQIQPGEIVGLYGGHITKNTRGAAQVMALSTGSIVAGNDPGKDARGKYDLVAFIGQVRTRVRGTVQAGDFIVASGLGDGIGVGVSPESITSEQFEQVVGQAWETSADSGLKSVRTAVGLIRRDPTVSRLLESNRRQAAQITDMAARLTAIEREIKMQPAIARSRATHSPRGGVDSRR